MDCPTRPKNPGGHDIFIGQNAEPCEDRERRRVIFGKGLQQAQVSTKAEWVIATGGGYFFLPSIRALRKVCLHAPRFALLTPGCTNGNKHALMHERFNRQSGDCRQHLCICYPALKQSNTRHQREELGEQFG
jgi:hypothetical protein